MATVHSVVRRALRLVGAQDSDEATSASASQDAIETLNSIGQRWLAIGLLAAWTDVDSPLDTLVTPATADEAIIYELGLRIAPEYGVQPSQTVTDQAGTERRLLWRDRLQSADTTTANGIILRALRIISNPGFGPDAVSFTGALGTLNALLAEWHEAGIGLPDYSFANLADSLASDAADRDAIAYQLAIRLAPEYGTELSGTAMQSASESMSRMRLRYFQPGVIVTDLPSTRCGFNIETGE